MFAEILFVHRYFIRLGITKKSSTGDSIKIKYVGIYLFFFLKECGVLKEKNWEHTGVLSALFISVKVSKYMI